MARYVKDENGNLICTAGGTRTWICTTAEHTRKVTAGTAPNNCVVAITDDYTEEGEVIDLTDEITGAIANFDFIKVVKNGHVVTLMFQCSVSVTVDTSQRTLFTLPSAWRPKTTQRMAGIFTSGQDSAAMFVVNRTGEVNATAATGASSLTGQPGSTISYIMED